MRTRTVFLLALLAALALPRLAPAANHAVSVGPGTNPGFSPQNVNINVGDTVIWTLMGGTHSVTADDDSFERTASSSWTTFSQTFNSAGTVGYHCSVHGSPGAGMHGTINVAGGGGGAGSLQFSSGSSSVGEGAGSKTITVTRTSSDNGAVSVQYGTSNGSATAGSDYTTTSGTLNWADNDDNPKTFSVPITDDSAEESNETIHLALSSPTGGATIGSPSSHTLTINDNDTPTGGPGTIRFTGATATVSESAANVALTAERVNGSNGAVSANFATANGTATAGADYQTTTSTVTWGNGDSADKTTQVPIVGDSVEETNETFTATLSAPTGGASIGTPSTRTVTITDDDITCSPCVADDTTLCLAGGSGDPNRFRVRVTWGNFTGGTGTAHATPLTADSGFFYFFNPNNLEILVKMVRGCGTELNAYWFFGAAASNLQLSYELVDTTACVTRVYPNPLGNFASFGDIAALTTCP